MNQISGIFREKLNFLAGLQLPDICPVAPTSAPLVEIKLSGDSENPADKVFTEEPTLTGAFPSCFISTPLYIDVSKINKIRHYKMKIPLEAKKPVSDTATALQDSVLFKIYCTQRGRYW